MSGNPTVWHDGLKRYVAREPADVISPSDQAEAERLYPDNATAVFWQRAAYIAGREDERAALAATTECPRSPPPAAAGEKPQFWKLCQCGNELHPIRAPLEEHLRDCPYRLAVEAAPAAAGVERERVIEAARRLSAAADAVEIALATPTSAVGYSTNRRDRIRVLKTEIEKLRALAASPPPAAAGERERRFARIAFDAWISKQFDGEETPPVNWDNLPYVSPDDYECCMAIGRALASETGPAEEER